MPYCYRGYLITSDTNHPHGGWQYVHDRYGGPPDMRCGHAATIGEAQEMIDELIGEDDKSDPMAHRPLTFHNESRMTPRPASSCIVCGCPCSEPDVVYELLAEGPVHEHCSKAALEGKRWIKGL